MMNIQDFLNNSSFHLISILACFLITYARILGKDYFWCIDDLDGIAKYTEKWVQEKDKDGKVTKEYKVDSYEEGGKQHKFLSFNPHLGFPGCVLRFLRLNFGKQFKVIGTNSKGHEVWGYAQSPRKHHLLSMIVQSLNLVLAYFFLIKVVPAPVAFGACLLYSVHPLTTQMVGWISGINYSLSMLFSFALLNCAYIPIVDLKFLSVAVFSFLSSISLYTGCLTWVVLLFLGLKWEALVAGVIGMAIFFWKGKETKDYRVKAFKEQNMQATTFWNWRKPIVMLKTLWYYMKFVWIPIQMGLYHVWGYFYEEPIERINKMFLLGVGTLAAFILGFYYGTDPVRLGITWYLTYFILFSNFITAQQFVADRYISISSFGVCLILSALLWGTPFFWVILGIYIMRTFLHLPTFKNEVDFYGSNFLNFRKSEVSLGNLGVAFMNQGMNGAAIDTWLLATKINPYYDVPWYNLYSVFKGNGRLTEARDFLTRCLNAKIVHFDKRWREESEQLDKMIENSKVPVRSTELFYHEAADHYKNKDHIKELECLRKFVTSDTTGLIPEMIEQVKARLKELESANLVCNPVPKQEGQVASGVVTLHPDAIIPPKQN